MNIDTGHLKYMQDGEKAPEGYFMVPQSLASDVREEMNGATETYVNINGPSKLSQWAKQKRKERNKMAKQSRKANRRA